MQQLKNTIKIFVFILLSTSIWAQEEVNETPLSISGSVDAYFRTNLTSDNMVGDASVAPVTSFANLPGFSLGMVNVILEKEKGKFGFVGDLVLGPRGTDAVFLSTGSANIVNQLYMYLNVSDAVTLTLGNFNTYLGYEVISPIDNFNYSTSYMFSYGPFSHTGLKADIALSDKMSLALAIMNPTDATEFNPFGSYVLGAQLGYESDAGGTWLNFRYGDEDGVLKADKNVIGDASAGNVFQVDLTTGFNVSDDFYLGLNATYLSTGAGETFADGGIEDIDADASGFYGLAAYAQLAVSEDITLGTRLEYFGEYNNFGIIPVDADGDGSMIDITLSANVAMEDLTIIPEFRIDLSSEDSAFPDSNLSPTSSLASFVLAAVYAF
ncbi:MAG: outer membrane beta-barrel protein [Bacteroidota bacterium]